MGKGDIRTRRGKINRGTTGNSRKKASKLRREKSKQNND
ncbi:MAG: 30S ribosomal protein THX [Gammaproteobacteria bacterium]|nr:30S ribosomal protein THX [Gammaproteobacteria bacterium]